MHKILIGDFRRIHFKKSIICGHVLFFLNISKNITINVILCCNLRINVCSVLSKSILVITICCNIFDVWNFCCQLVQRIWRRPSMNPVCTFFKPKYRIINQSHRCWFCSSSNVPIGLQDQDFFTILSQIISSRCSSNSRSNYNHIVLILSEVGRSSVIILWDGEISSESNNDSCGHCQERISK